MVTKLCLIISWLTYSGSCSVKTIKRLPVSLNVYILLVQPDFNLLNSNFVSLFCLLGKMLLIKFRRRESYIIINMGIV